MFGLGEWYLLYEAEGRGHEKVKSLKLMLFHSILQVLTILEIKIMLSGITIYFALGIIKNKKKLQPMLKKALNDSDIQTELTPVIMNRILSGVQLWSQDQVTGLMGKTTELDS